MTEYFDILNYSGVKVLANPGENIPLSVLAGIGGQSIQDNFVEIAQRTGNVYATSGAPGVNNDDRDTAGVGTIFSMWSKWHDTHNDHYHVCLDSASGAAVWSNLSSGGGGGGLNDVVDDTTPQLGGALDCQDFAVSGVGTLVVGNTSTSDALIQINDSGGISRIRFGDSSDVDVGQIVYEHSPDIMSLEAGASSFLVGTSTKVIPQKDIQLGSSVSIITNSDNDINITPDGTGQIVLDGISWPDSPTLTTGHVLKASSSSAVAFSSAMPEIVLKMNEANFAGESNPATPVYRNNLANLLLAFDDTTQETANWECYLPSTYAGGGLSVDIYWAAASATTDGVQWGGSIERQDIDSHDLDADAYAAQNTVDDTCAGTSGQLSKATITFTDGADMDSLAAGELFRFQLQRNVGAGADIMSGDAQVKMIVIRET